MPHATVVAVIAKREAEAEALRILRAIVYAYTQDVDTVLAAAFAAYQREQIAKGSER